MTSRQIASRLSSARRIDKLGALVAAFAARDLGNAGVALLLECSLTAARNYLAELLDAGVIDAHPVRQAAGCLDRTLYRRSADPLAAGVFLAALTRADCVAGCSPGAGSAPARRDPLVAALFGAPRPSSAC
ncbi:hypothetical protein [Massilia sp. DWR3-1-1]|uniref:hypothetical protein n=1 Tax=Massilia sp. DWR3-1-1 TaxID=2804559 RepID=UPI003CFB325B